MEGGGQLDVNKLTGQIDSESNGVPVVASKEAAEQIERQTPINDDENSPN